MDKQDIDYYIFHLDLMIDTIKDVIDDLGQIFATLNDLKEDISNE